MENGLDKTPPASGNGTAPAPNGGAGTTNTTSKLANSGLNVVTHSADNPTPTQPKLPKASTNIQWGQPIGLPIRNATDEPLMVFRRAVGINSDLAPASTEPAAAELGRREPAGMYRNVVRLKRRRRAQHFCVSWLLNLLHFSQVVIGAALTALGPDAARYTVHITVLGAVNTVIAGVLALMKGQGLPERLHKDEMEFRRLQEWIEETEALLVTGVIGRDRRDVGVLVESAFRKFNSAKMSAENNRPDNYVPDPGSQAHGRKRTSSPESNEEGTDKAATK